MRPLLSLALLVTLLFPGAALACTCHWAGPFTKMAPRADLVALVEVRAHDRHRLTAVVLDRLSGTEERRLITVRGGDDGNCRPSIARFPRGTRWILALARGDAGDYALSVCGEFWLEVRGDRAVGRITSPEYTETLESVPLADALAWARLGGATRLAP